MYMKAVQEVPLSQRTALSRDSSGNGSTALISLSSQNLVVECTHSHTKTSPFVEVVRCSDSPAGALFLADGQKLNECLGALDGWGISASSGVNIVL